MLTEIQDFNSVLNDNTPTVVDFYAPWCQPCKTLAPMLDQFSTRYDGKIKFYKLNVDDNPAVAAAASVQTVPTLIFVKNGAVVDVLTGMQPPSKLQKKLEALLT